MTWAPLATGHCNRSVRLTTRLPCRGRLPVPPDSGSRLTRSARLIWLVSAFMPGVFHDLARQS
jgi:hypothetical protein